MNAKIELENGERIIKIFSPRSKLNLEYFLKRPALILTNKRVIFRSVFKFFDKEIEYKNISDVVIGSNITQYALEVLKRGESPSAEGIESFEPAYRPFIRCTRLSKEDKKEAFNLIKEKTV